MRLIDADLFMENARKSLNCDERCCECEYVETLCDIYKMTLTQPTAFDLEKVIEKLSEKKNFCNELRVQEQRKNMYSNESYDFGMKCYDEAIKIIKEEKNR